MIAVNLTQLVLEVGEMLEGEIVWSSEKQKKIEKVNLSVGWRTEGRGDIEKGKVQELDIFNVPAFFKVQIPIKGPVSYDGQLIRIIWEVSLDIKYHGLFNNEEKKIKEVFRVMPRTIES